MISINELEQMMKRCGFLGIGPSMSIPPIFSETKQSLCLNPSIWTNCASNSWQDGNISQLHITPAPTPPTCRTSIPSHPTRCAEVHWYDPLIVWRCRDVVGTTPWFSVGFQLTRVNLRPWDFDVKLPGVKTNSNNPREHTKKNPEPTVYVLEFLNHFGVFRGSCILLQVVCWGPLWVMCFGLLL